ncbi:transposase, partial [Acidithiobacillus caldus ATCC 51756]
ALTRIGALYRVEQQIREQGLEGEPKRDYRSRHAGPIAEAFFGWCHQQRQRMDLLNSDPLAKALVYAENHQAQLKVYL